MVLDGNNLVLVKYEALESHINSLSVWQNVQGFTGNKVGSMLACCLSILVCIDLVEEIDLNLYVPSMERPSIGVQQE